MSTNLLDPPEAAHLGSRGHEPQKHLGAVPRHHPVSCSGGDGDHTQLSMAARAVQHLMDEAQMFVLEIIIQVHFLQQLEYLEVM